MMIGWVTIDMKGSIIAVGRRGITVTGNNLFIKFEILSVGFPTHRPISMGMKEQGSQIVMEEGSFPVPREVWLHTLGNLPMREMTPHYPWRLWSQLEER